MDILKDIASHIENEMFNSFKEKTFKALEKHFRSKEEYNSLFDDLSSSNKVKLINCGNYYHYLKFNDGLNANIQLIMCFSIIEKIYSEEEYIEFKEWCDKKQKGVDISEFKSFSDLLKCLKTKYHTIHGSKQKTLGFFDKYFDEEDKRKLLKSFKYRVTNENLNGKKITFEKLIDILYTMRNNFVHDARFIPINHEGSVGGNIIYNHKETFIHSQLPMKDFLNMFEKAFIQYFRLV